MRYLVRLFGKPETKCVIESGDPDHAPDYYVHEHCEPGEGRVFFIEVADIRGGPWVLWRVEDQGVLIPGTGNALLTFRVDAEEARLEMSAGKAN
jgi:hypothetical protein